MEVCGYSMKDTEVRLAGLDGRICKVLENTVRHLCARRGMFSCGNKNSCTHLSLKRGIGAHSLKFYICVQNAKHILHILYENIVYQLTSILILLMFRIIVRVLRGIHTLIIHVSKIVHVNYRI